MALTGAERTANYRYVGQVEKAAEKLLDLIQNPPPKYAESFSAMPNRFETAELLYDCAALLLNSEWMVTEDKDDRLNIVIVLPEPEEGLPLGYTPEDMENERETYDFYKLWQKQKTSKKPGVRVSRNTFCEELLGARLTNARWGWVGVRESENAEPGALYIFAWEHNLGVDGEDTVGLFHKEVSVDENGRRRPGHRDALEKIERVRSGELIPFIVWQVAEDPDASRKKVESTNAEFVTRCELYIDDRDHWVGRLIENNPITFT